MRRNDQTENLYLFAKTAGVFFQMQWQFGCRDEPMQEMVVSSRVCGIYRSQQCRAGISPHEMDSWRHVML